MPGVGRKPALLDRERPLARAQRLLEDARRGAGSVLVVRGAAGIGKTALLDAIALKAAGTGFRVARARGGELEADVPFGVARQILEPMIVNGSESEGILEGPAAISLRTLRFEPGGAREQEGAVRHGLYWLVSNLAEHRPLLLAADDVQWADEQSAAWLAYLARRIGDLSVLLVVATRPDAPTGVADSLNAVFANPASEVVDLQTLGRDAVTTIVTEALGPISSESLISACHDATGGNPFYLAELIDELAVHAADRRGDDLLEIVANAGPSSVARRVLWRVGRQGSDAAAVAQAIAVLGDGAELRHIAALAKVDPTGAAATIDGLITADVLSEDPLRFRHPIMRTAVYADIPSGRRGELHTTAANIFDDEGASTVDVCTHLLKAPRLGNARSVDHLRHAARLAAERAPEAAIRYLTRALDEPPPPATRADVLFELGSAQRRVGSPAAVESLGASMDLLSDIEMRAAAAREMALALLNQGMIDLAVDGLNRAIEELRSAGLVQEALSFEGEWIGISRLDIRFAAAARRRARRFSDLQGRSPAERLVLACVADDAWRADHSADVTVELALRALGDGRLLREQGPDCVPMYHAIWALIAADRLDEATSALCAARDSARENVSLLPFTVATSMLSTTAYRRGRLIDAEAEARISIDAARAQDLFVVPTAIAFLIDALCARGQPDTAEMELEQAGLSGSLPELWFYQTVLLSRARLRIAQGRDDEACDSLEELRRRHKAWGVSNAVGLPWRRMLATTLMRRGQTAEARTLANELRGLADLWNTPRALAEATLCEAIVDPSDISRFEDAERLLANAPDRLAHAEALLELGSAYRRRGSRTDARTPLRTALDIATHAGAEPIARRAREELKAAGARPRRAAVTGAGALTASEHRVARMAATGMTNRQIAQSLFISAKTVEKHLGNAYMKLGVGSRHDLADAIGTGEAGEPIRNSEL